VARRVSSARTRRDLRLLSRNDRESTTNPEQRSTTDAAVCRGRRRIAAFIRPQHQNGSCFQSHSLKGKGSAYSITERRVLELIPVLGNQPAADVNHKPGGRLPLLSARPAVTPATRKRAATNFAA